MSDTNADVLQKVVSLSKRRGFVFPGSEIYGGLANTYDFGPLGVLLKKNIADLWWKFFVTRRPEMFGLDTCNLMSPNVWEASGHTANFTNVLVDCTNCKFRTRADHLIEDNVPTIGNVEGKPLEELDQIISNNKIVCPKCGKSVWTKCRNFNQLFETKIGIITTGQDKAYLRGELAQGMFVNFKNVLDSVHPKLPFGIAQSGKAYRNEITMGKFTFRTLEFDLAEFEYFVNPKDWEQHFEFWKNEMSVFFLVMEPFGAFLHVHVVAVPFRGEGRHGVNAPVKIDAELGIIKPRGIGVLCERFPFGQVRPARLGLGRRFGLGKQRAV